MLRMLLLIWMVVALMVPMDELRNIELITLQCQCESKKKPDGNECSVLLIAYEASSTVIGNTTLLF